ncbi:MAG: SPOR domain-containing protein [Chromatiales bacterium]|nr:SPOR domain-containing protein [Chromatiales bacterium]
MDLRLKHRLVGAAVLLALAVIFLPMLLRAPQTAHAPDIERMPIPERPAYFEQALEPVAAPEPPPPMPEPAPVAELDAPPAVPSVETKPESGIALSAWVLQVASFTSEKYAERLRDKLRKKGYATFMETVQGSKGELYRVRVGPELDQKKLGRIRDTIAKEHKLKGIIIRYP